MSKTVLSVLSPARTHPFRRRLHQLTTEFSFGLGAETSIYSSMTVRKERDIPQAESVDMDVGMELRTRQDEVKLDVDVITMDGK